MTKITPFFYNSLIVFWNRNSLNGSYISAAPNTSPTQIRLSQYGKKKTKKVSHSWLIHKRNLLVVHIISPSPISTNRIVIYSLLSNQFSTFFFFFWQIYQLNLLILFKKRKIFRVSSPPPFSKETPDLIIVSYIYIYIKKKVFLSGRIF